MFTYNCCGYCRILVSKYIPRVNNTKKELTICYTDLRVKEDWAFITFFQNNNMFKTTFLPYMDVISIFGNITTFRYFLDCNNILIENFPRKF